MFVQPVIKKAMRIAHKKFKNGQVAVRLRSNGFVVPLTNLNRERVKTVLGIYHNGEIRKV